MVRGCGPILRQCVGMKLEPYHPVLPLERVAGLPQRFACGNRLHLARSHFIPAAFGFGHPSMIDLAELRAIQGRLSYNSVTKRLVRTTQHCQFVRFEAVRTGVVMRLSASSRWSRSPA